MNQPPGPDALLSHLDEEQREAAQATHGAVCMLAGAGTGKTTAITHRIAYGVATGVYPPNRVMALTFTSKSAGELRARLARLGAGGVSARTFHASALAQLGYFWPQVIGGVMPRILESKGRLLGQAAERLRLRLDTATLRDLAAEIEWRKVSRLSLAEYALAERAMPPQLDLERMLDLQQAYEDLKDERRQLDFEDVLLATAGMIESEPRVAEQVREQYRFFVVDEYQDVSPLQHYLLQLWLGDRRDVCVVGDASQTIYSFAGASSRFLLRFPSDYPEATVVRLERNYRSSPPIVDTANRLMRDRPGALVLHPAARGVRSASPQEAPSVAVYDNDMAEARAVARAIEAEIAAGRRPQDIAVLYRVNSQALAVSTALGDLGVSTRVTGAARFFELPEVKQAVMMLKGAVVGGVPEPLFKTVSDVVRSLGWTQEAPEARGAVRDRWESLNTIMALAEEMGPRTTLRAFVDDLAHRAATQNEPTQRAVTLATIHAAKGLEWESVHLIGLSEGLLPISYAADEEAIEEERRLLYVGITRARERLALSWSRGQQRSGDRQPSRFLAELRSRTPDAPPTRASSAAPFRGRS
ncbi:ATP-dependent helicase [Salinibacterium sp. SYSU T00001]|uniref:ATP-dependent helicase n=1 Tax=Homoserinimonas sedimenticola TaxID=2986805 RepID=UPI002235F380|nr:ATP-dependent helicase [Salinibacterium sedimenticola]MCW4386526.1 ATP-dependent helicase [Salinibacterium sedimenticola]